MNTHPVAGVAQEVSPELNDLIKMLGSERVVALLCKFQLVLENSLTCELLNHAEIAMQAHKMVSQAGMLGFHSLSNAARELEGAAMKELKLDEVHGIAIREQQRALAEIQQFRTLLSSSRSCVP